MSDIHMTRLGPTPIAAGGTATYLIAWRDHCDRCGETKPAPQCPVTIDPNNGELLRYEYRHGCGELIHIDYMPINVDDAEGDTAVLAEMLSVAHEVLIGRYLAAHVAYHQVEDVMV